MLMSPLTAAAMRQVPRGIAGSASGIINTTRSIGQLMGIAVLGTVLQSRMVHETEPRLDPLDLDPERQGQLVRMAEAAQFEEIREDLASFPDLLPAVMRAIDVAFADAVQFTFFVSAAIAFLGMGIALLLRERQRTEEPATERTSTMRSASAPGGK